MSKPTEPDPSTAKYILRDPVTGNIIAAAWDDEGLHELIKVLRERGTQIDFCPCPTCNTMRH